MTKTLESRFVLPDGARMPYIGLGLFKLNEQELLRDAISEAAAIGYRLFDTAAVYNNEQLIGEELRASNVPREELFLSTKIWNGNLGYDSTLRAVERTLTNLKMDYLDLYSIHWPIAGKYRDTWLALERLKEEKVVRSIGVANFKQYHLDDLLTVANEKPVINQIETHPLLPQNELRAYMAKLGIAHGAWSPLAKGALMQDKLIDKIAEKHGAQVDQVVLQWHLNRNTIIFPKSINPKRLKENAELSYFHLDSHDMERLDKLAGDVRVGPDPDDLAYFVTSIEREREELANRE